MQGRKGEVGQSPAVTDTGVGEPEEVVLKPSQGCHPEAPEGTPRTPSTLDALELCYWSHHIFPTFFVAITHWRLPPPGISENMAPPSIPDLQEEKLRSQLEEEKTR